ncbi:MAG: T9SS type A sorting domain-containing protein [Chitinophagaceae bacterium]
MKNLFTKLLSAWVLTFALALSVQAQVPKMSSFPSATAVIFLDFDGQTVQNTSWNYAGPIFCAPAGLDSTKIVSIFNRVSEDYRPFNINVTTDSTKYLAAPINRRMRVILTVTYEWYGQAGGVAFINSFTWSDDTPCFVFTGLLGYSTKFIAEAAAHEAGHTLGLYHQSSYDANCVKTSEYNSGTGSGEIGWAPIMGVGYYRNFTLWNNGPNPYGCNNLQSDLSVITSANGFTFRTDDHSSSWNQATALTFTNNQFIANGVITQSTDVDLFKFTQPASGHFILNAIPYNVGTGNEGSNLDLQVTLYDNSHNQLNIFNPGTLLSSIVDTVLNPGNYFLRIEGRGNVNAPNYASLGSFSLQGNFSTASTLPLRRLELQGSLLNERHKLSWIIDADEQVVEQILEYTTDGRKFNALVHPVETDRQYLYTPAYSNAVQYRLKVTFDNGRTYYSNIVTLRNTANDTRPKLLGNIVSGMVTVTSPGNYSYAIYDLNGRTAARGQLTQGMNLVSSSNLSGGMYVIRFSDNNNTWTEKFVRQ